MPNFREKSIALQYRKLGRKVYTNKSKYTRLHEEFTNSSSSRSQNPKVNVVAKGKQRTANRDDDAAGGRVLGEGEEDDVAGVVVPLELENVAKAPMDFLEANDIVVE